MTTNVFAPLGFNPIRNKASSGAGNLNEYPVLYSDTSLIGIGDLVYRSGGYITKAGPTVTPMGIWQGWQFRTRAPLGGSFGGAADTFVVPFKKAWTGAQTLNQNQTIVAMIDDDPFMTFRVQCVGIVAVTDVGKLVDLADCPGGPELTLYGRGRQRVSTPTTYYNITAYSADTAGSGYVQDQVDLLVNGVIQDIRPSDITVTSGGIASISLLNNVQGLPDNTPTTTVATKASYIAAGGATGSGAVITSTKSSAQTAAQFKIERIISQPFRAFDSSNRTTGYDMSAAGANAWLEVSYAKHQRGSTVATG